MEETFKIENDKMADWAIAQIHESENERDRLITLAEEQINDLNDRINELKEKCDNETKFLKSCLEMYFETVPSKETKTQKTYKLLSGTLVFKKPSVKINHDDEALLKYLKDTEGDEYIKIKESVDWAGFKKNLVISNDEVIDEETGEVIPAEVCTVEDVPASFGIKY